ncbi:uncharacterized protein LOC126843141 isoform X2 [Adelges cooleyi]|uniref:uncharacterized protein LOC126843141 isoform X2 n=1 Tax=Adelges cooleyi TaxID=133065 RepID=UPI00217FC0EC|nr:uncharacterized protein LOC126843141 isoform X2 [Adelges cooleyi]
MLYFAYLKCEEDVHVTVYDNVSEQSPLSQIVNLLKKEQEKYEIIMNEQKTKDKSLMTENISYYYLPNTNVKAPEISKKQSTLNNFYKTLPRKENYKERILKEAKKVFCFKNNVDYLKNDHGNNRHIDFRTPQQALPITFVSPKINKTLPTAIRSKPFVHIKAKQFQYNPNVTSFGKNNINVEEPIISNSYFYIDNVICDNVINESDTLNITTDTSNIQTRGCPPFKWFHLIYLAIKNSPTEYVSIHDVQIFISRWFPFYSNKSKERVESALLTYTPHYFNSTVLNFKMNDIDDFPYKWTVNISSTNVLEFQTRSIAKQYSNENKATKNFPDKLESILKGYGLRHLGYDPGHQAIPNLKTDHFTKNI